MSTRSTSGSAHSALVTRRARRHVELRRDRVRGFPVRGRHGDQLDHACRRQLGVDGQVGARRVGRADDADPAHAGPWLRRGSAAPRSRTAPSPPAPPRGPGPVGYRKIIRKSSTPAWSRNRPIVSTHSSRGAEDEPVTHELLERDLRRRRHPGQVGDRAVVEQRAGHRQRGVAELLQSRRARPVRPAEPDRGDVRSAPGRLGRGPVVRGHRGHRVQAHERVGDPAVAEPTGPAQPARRPRGQVQRHATGLRRAWDHRDVVEGVDPACEGEPVVRVRLADDPDGLVETRARLCQGTPTVA